MAEPYQQQVQDEATSTAIAVEERVDLLEAAVKLRNVLWELDLGGLKRLDLVNQLRTSAATCTHDGGTIPPGNG